MHAHWLSILRAIVQVFEYRYNVTFAEDYASVTYTNHNFQKFSQNDSCGACSLNDTFVGINRSLARPPCNSASTGNCDSLSVIVETLCAALACYLVQGILGSGGQQWWLGIEFVSPISASDLELFIHWH